MHEQLVDPYLFHFVDKISPMAIPEASVVNINGLENSGYCNTCSSHSFSFNVSKDSS